MSSFLVGYDDEDGLEDSEEELEKDSYKPTPNGQRINNKVDPQKLASVHEIEQINKVHTKKKDSLSSEQEDKNYEDIEIEEIVEVEVPTDEEDSEKRADRISAYLQKLNWTLVWDEHRQQYYYWNKQSHKTTWECPPIPRFRIQKVQKIRKRVKKEVAGGVEEKYKKEYKEKASDNIMNKKFEKQYDLNSSKTININQDEENIDNNNKTTTKSGFGKVSSTTSTSSLNPKKEDETMNKRQNDPPSDVLDFHLCTEEELRTYLENLERKIYGEDSDIYDINDLAERRGYYNDTNPEAQRDVRVANNNSISKSSNKQANEKFKPEPLDIISCSLLCYDINQETNSCDTVRLFSDREMDLLLNFESTYERKNSQGENSAKDTSCKEKYNDNPVPSKCVEEAFELVKTLYSLQDEEDEENLELQIYKIKFATRLEDWRRGYLPTINFAKCLLNVRQELSVELLKKSQVGSKKRKSVSEEEKKTNYLDNYEKNEPLLKKSKCERIDKLEQYSSSFKETQANMKDTFSTNPLTIDNTLIIYWPKIVSPDLPFMERKRISLQKLSIRFRHNAKEGENADESYVESVNSVTFRQIADDYFAVSYTEKKTRDRELVRHSNQEGTISSVLEDAKSKWILASSKEHYLRLIQSNEELSKLKNLPEFCN